ncbi:MAG: hypothetical protein AAGC73_05585 [Verrucomicrobiota bacterium]
MQSYKTLFLAPIAAGAFFLCSCGDQAADTEKAVEAPAPKKPSYPATADAAVKMIADEVSKGKLGVIWKSMPSSYQTDVSDYVALASTKLDAELYDKTFAFLGKLADVADKQKDFILNSELGGGQPVEAKQQLEAVLPSLVEIFRGIAGSEIATLEALKTFDGQKFFESTLSDLVEDVDTLSQLSDETEFTLSDLSQLSVEVVEAMGDQATLKMTVPDEEPETQSFTKIEDRWVPSEIAASWTQSFEEAKAQLDALSEEELAAKKPQILGAFAMIDGVLTQLDSAETQEQFDQALQGAMMPIMGLMMMGGGMGMPGQ